jgi:hypothetical protein
MAEGLSSAPHRRVRRIRLPHSVQPNGLNQPAARTKLILYAASGAAPPGVRVDDRLERAGRDDVCLGALSDFRSLLPATSHGSVMPPCGVYIEGVEVNAGGASPVSVAPGDVFRRSYSSPTVVSLRANYFLYTFVVLSDVPTNGKIEARPLDSVQRGPVVARHQREPISCRQ